MTEEDVACLHEADGSKRSSFRGCKRGGTPEPSRECQSARSHRTHSVPEAAFQRGIHRPPAGGHVGSLQKRGHQNGADENPEH